MAKSWKVNSVIFMCDSVMRRKIGRGAFLSLCCLDLLDMTGPIVTGEGGNMCFVSFDNGDRGRCDPSRPWCYSRVTSTVPERMLGDEPGYCGGWGSEIVAHVVVPTGLFLLAAPCSFLRRESFVSLPASLLSRDGRISGGSTENCLFTGVFCLFWPFWMLKLTVDIMAFSRRYIKCYI